LVFGVVRALHPTKPQSSTNYHFYIRAKERRCKDINENSFHLSLLSLSPLHPSFKLRDF